jgi:hypothetical protein
MRVRAVVASALLLLPSASSAQLLPMPGAGRRGPLGPVPLSPQPAPIARAIAYRRLRVSIESYPLVGYIQSSGLAAGASSFTTFGAGTRAEYRLNRFVSATADLTSSFLGSPMLVQTAEVGTRLRPESEGRLQPFVDLRAGYISANDRSLTSTIDNGNGFPATPSAYGARYSRGFGGVVGVGTEYALTRTLWLTTAGSVMRSRMHTDDFRATQPDASFAMTSYRFTVGLRYNPIRLITP